VRAAHEGTTDVGIEFRHPYRLDGERLPGQLQARQVEEVLDDLPQMRGARQDVARIIAILPVPDRPEHLALDHLRKTDDRVQGRAQFVAHHREEAALGLVRRLGLALRLAMSVGAPSGRLLLRRGAGDPAAQSPVGEAHAQRALEMSMDAGRDPRHASGEGEDGARHREPERVAFIGEAQGQQEQQRHGEGREGPAHGAERGGSGRDHAGGEEGKEQLHRQVRRRRHQPQRADAPDQAGDD
jgi:hypothetical protein